MSTRALISLQQKDNIQSIYCNSDGYIEHCGVMLNKYYNTLNKIKELISYGNLFCLGKQIGEAHDINTPFEHQFWHPKYDKTKSTPETWCKFYHRDEVEYIQLGKITGPEGRKIMQEKFDMYKDLNIYDFILNIKNEEELFETYNLESGVEYIYLFKDNNWFVKNNNVDTFNLLSENIKYINTV
jgi:hypothetical protein